jgi:purine-binding chemotaxis protein CheW
MSGKDSLENYFDALLGEDGDKPAKSAPGVFDQAGNPVPPPATELSGAEDLSGAIGQAQASIEAKGVFADASDALPPAPTPAPIAASTPTDAFEDVFEQAHAAAKAAGVFNQAAASQPVAAPAVSSEIDELEAVFEQAHAEAKAAGVFDQASHALPPAASPIDELEAVFEQAHAEAKAAGVFDQASHALPPAASPIDELEAVFEQAHAEAKAAGVFDQASTGTPAKAELDELEAAFDAAAAAAQQARAGHAAASALPAQVPMPGPAQTVPAQGLLKPQLARRSEAIKRRLARRREAEQEQQKAVPSERFERWLRFQMAGQSYAVELLKVQEVQRVPDIMPVRGAAPHVVGVMNLRGQIIAVIDLAACIGLPHEPLTDHSRVIVLETEEETVGLLVSAVAEVISLSERTIENPVSSIPALPREALIGIARHAHGMSVLLDATVFLR